MDENYWSLVLTDFDGNWREFETAVPRLFGRDGLDVYTLVLGRNTLPSEILSGLSHDLALQMVYTLSSIGAQVKVVRTTEVCDVQYRADDVWATHSTGLFTFSEVEDMIFAAGALNARRNLNVLRNNSRMTAAWQYERTMNYTHVDISWTELAPRERVREEVKLMEQYARTLQTLYPNKLFILSHILGHSVSFYQFRHDAPANDIPPQFSGQEKVWCVACHRQQPYLQRLNPDPEFPKALWGDCLVCGNEVLVDTWEVLYTIGSTRK